MHNEIIGKIKEKSLNSSTTIRKSPQYKHIRLFGPTTCDIGKHKIMKLQLWMCGCPVDAAGSPFCQACGIHTAH